MNHHLVSSELDSWVVLYFPQSFVKSFPLVGLPKLVFVLLVREEVFGTEECPAEIY